MPKNGRPALGPYQSDDLPTPSVTIEPLSGKARIALDSEEIAGFLKPFNGRAQIVLVALLQGYSRGQAAMQARITDTTVRDWGRKHPEFAEAVEMAQSWGFSSVIESELYSRALAGPEDRGSMRALELVTKARSPDYREKVAGRLDIVHHAERSMGQMAAGWDESKASD